MLNDVERADQENQGDESQRNIDQAAVSHAGDARWNGDDEEVYQRQPRTVRHACYGPGGVGRNDADDQHVNGGIRQYEAPHAGRADHDGRCDAPDRELPLPSGGLVARQFLPSAVR
jgi:hypothetical protein